MTEYVAAEIDRIAHDMGVVRIEVVSLRRRRLHIAAGLVEKLEDFNR